MNRVFGIFFGSMLFLFFVMPIFVNAFVFNTNLKLGDSGVDVLELQKQLNKDADTVVSTFGAGSAGNETQYFGPATLSAVVKFQNKYASEVLNPLGIFSGTGFFGSVTRQKMNSLAEVGGSVGLVAGNIPTQNTQSQTAQGFVLPSFTGQIVNQPSLGEQFNIFDESENSKVQLAFLSANVGVQGSSLELTGTGFDLSGNTIYFGSNAIANIPATSANKISMIVPASVPTGVYDIEVGNQKGKSESNAYFVVKNVGVVSPKILSTTPATVSLGDEVTLNGENFTPTGNRILTSFGVILNVSSSDGKTLKFKLDAPDSIEGFSELFDGTFEMKVYLTVVNTNGVSDRNNPAIIILK